MRKSKTTAIIIILLYIFMQNKVRFIKKIFVKTIFIFNTFFAWQVIENAVIKHQR